MKKVIFLFAMVLAVSFAMAQTTVIDQTSNNTVSSQSATVTQSGVSTVKITQVTDKTQSNSNSPFVVGDPAPFNNIAVAKQSGGNDNKITVKQVAEGNIWGSGANTTNATQNGKKNTLTQTQISGNHTSGGMDFISTQKGESNIGEQFSKKTEADFTMTQDGKLNEAYQKTTGEKTGVLEADIKQIGTSNKGTQLFHGSNVRNAGASIDQNGTSNTAKQEFDNSSIALWNSPSKADIIQRDKKNNAYQSQYGEGSYQYTKQSGLNNEAKLWSIGNFNEAYTKQAGTNGTIKVVQKQDAHGIALAGEGNSVMLSQDGTGSFADIMQDGLTNVVEGLGGAGTYAINNNGASLKVKQKGMDNLVQSKQLAGSETVMQMGMNNTAIVNQY